MAFSQIQCLDDNHVNFRINESKPEFFYSEEQRLALETLIDNGRNSFKKYIQTNNIREFLSELEQEHISKAAEVYSPGSEKSDDELNGTSDDTFSLQYWPDRSDYSLPDLDIGWPDYTTYRGVSRVNVYVHPPMEGQAHIKEIVRKTIGQAQKVIAVVMDLFTDVDIFKDLLDACFKRRVAVYILLEATGVPHFLRMCEKAGMHAGHLKNLRVRSIRGTEFFTRSSKKLCGSQSQKFMFVDGDKAVSGSYSFTWSASRLDRNIITVITGQAVDIFDKLFQELYLMSGSVSLSKINLSDEPKLHTTPHAELTFVPSATMALRLINPKYALVANNAMTTANGTLSNKGSTKNTAAKNGMKTIKQIPPIHPGLYSLERANMILYLPTWPEPDPPSDVIGFINIRDTSKPAQAHLMRSELFETSKAIRFKDPFHVQERDLSERACPREKPKLSSLSVVSVPENPLTQSETCKETTKGHTSLSIQEKCPESSQEKASVPNSTTVIKNQSDNTTPVLTVTKKQLPSGSLPNQRRDVVAEATKLSHLHSSAVLQSIVCSTSRSRKESDRPVTPQPPKSLSTSSSSCNHDFKKLSASHDAKPCLSSADPETTLVKQNCEDISTNGVKQATVSQNQRDANVEADVGEGGGVDQPHAQSPQSDSNLSSTSEEYFECIDSLDVDDSSKVKFDRTQCESEHSWAEEVNTSASNSLSTVKPQPENPKDIFQTVGQHVHDVSESKMQTVLEGQSNRQHATEMMVPGHTTPKSSDKSERLQSAELALSSVLDKTADPTHNIGMNNVKNLRQREEEVSLCSNEQKKKEETNSYLQEMQSTEQLLILEDFDLQGECKAGFTRQSGQKKNQTVPEPPSGRDRKTGELAQETKSNSKATEKKPDGDRHPVCEGGTCRLAASEKEKAELKRSHVYPGKANQQQAKPKMEVEARKLHRLPPRPPIQTKQEAKGGTARVTPKPVCSSRPTRPQASPVVPGRFSGGKQCGQSRAAQSASQSTGHITIQRSTQTQHGHLQTNQPLNLSSSKNKLSQVQSDRSKVAQVSRRRLETAVTDGRAAVRKSQSKSSQLKTLIDKFSGVPDDPQKQTRGNKGAVK